LLVVLAIVTVVLSIPVSKSLSDGPERCCAPKQFSSKISLSTGMVLPDGKTYTSYAHYNFSYDESRGMIGMKGVSFNVPDQQQTNLWIIETLNDGQDYVIDLDTKQCTKSMNPVKQLNCIPETAIYIDSSTYGYGDKQIIGDTWLIQINGTIYYSTVSRGDCIPLTANIFMQEPAMVIGMTTTNFVARVDDPSIFDIPSQCKTIV